MKYRTTLPAIGLFALLVGGPHASAQEVFTSKPEFGPTSIAGQQYPTAAIAIDDAIDRVAVIGVDDLATAGTVLSIASSLKGLFSTGDSDNDRVLQQLDVLRQQHEKMIGLLEKIVGILEQLDVLIAQAVRSEFITALRLDIKATITEYYETRATLAKNPRYRDEAHKIFLEQWKSLSRLTRRMMGYGPAVFQTVGTTMFFEADTARRILRLPEEQVQKLITYRTYFRDTLDPKQQGSVGHSVAYLRDLIAKADAILTAADQALSGQRTFAGDTYCESRPCEEGGTIRTCYRRFATINGNREAGYSVAHSQEQISESGHCHICARCLTVRQSLARVTPSLRASTANLPTLPGQGGNSPDQRKDFWNATIAVLAEAKKQLAVAERSAENARLYLEEVEKRIKQLGG